MLAARPIPMTARFAACGLAFGLLLQGCEKPVTIPPPPPAPLPPHAGPPPARLCTVSPFSVKDGGSANVEMVVSNEGGYCAATVNIR